MTDRKPLFRVYPTDCGPIVDADSPGAVIAALNGRPGLILSFSISEAREFALALELAADEAELKLKD